MTPQPPVVVRQWAQPTTGVGTASALPKPQEIGFFGHKAGETPRTFKVLAGEGAPTLTGGWVVLNKIKRFQRVSVTVPEGYEPLILSVPILFDALAESERAESVEANIAKLEWMAGRPAHRAEVADEPPYVEVYSLKTDGTQSNLVPKQFQTIPGVSQQWYVTAITFDPNPLRDRGGERIRQLATVELTEIVLSASALSKARKERDKSKNSFKSYTVHAGVNTIRKVAGAEGVPGSWKAILEANPKLGNSGDKPLKKGTLVKIPETVFKQAPR